MLFIRQNWIKKRTRHTRRFAKRFVRLHNSSLLSYKRSPLEYPNQQPSCHWNLADSSVKLKFINSFWHIIINQPRNEIEFVFEIPEDASRWYDYLYRTAKFGSLQLSYAIYPPKQLLRTLNGSDTPWFIKPISLIYNAAYWTENALHANLPYLKLTLFFRDTIADTADRLLTRKVIIVVQAMGSESHFILENGHVATALGGDCTMDLASGLVLIKLILLSNIEPVSEFSWFPNISCHQKDRLEVFVYEQVESSASTSGIMNYIYYNGQTSATTHTDMLDLVWHAGLGFNHFQWYCTHLDLLSTACVEFSGRRAALTQDFIQWANLECSWPWWHIFEATAQEPQPLTSELNYNDWLVEAKRLATVYKRLRRAFGSVQWLVSFEQPPSTVACLIYLYVALNIFGTHLITTLILIPLLFLFLLNAPGTETFLRQKLIPTFPLSLVLLDNSRYCIPSFVAHSCITLTDVPITEDFSAHHALIPNTRRLKFTKYPYIAAFIKTTACLFLWTVYGGFPTGFYTNPDICNGGPLLSPAKHTSGLLALTTRRFSDQPETRLSDPAAAAARRSSDLPRYTMKTKRHIRRNQFTKRSKIAGYLAPLRWLWLRISPYHTLQKRSSWHKPVLAILTRNANTGYNGPPPSEDDSGVELPLKSDIESRNISKPKDLIPKTAAMSVLWKFTSSLLTQTDPVEILEEPIPNKTTKTTIRSVVRDVASVSRTIIGYRRSIEKALNLLAWTHPLASLVGINLATLSSHTDVHNMLGYCHSISALAAMELDHLHTGHCLLEKSKLGILIAQRNPQIHHRANWMRTAGAARKLQDSLWNQRHLNGHGNFERQRSIVANLKSSPDFCKGPVRLSTGKGWIINIIDHTLYKEQVCGPQ